MSLQVDSLTKCYKKKCALNNISFSLDTGIYGLLGPNGAGKTTLMNCIAGILKPDQGRVLYGDRDISELKEEYRRILGFLPQMPTFYKSFRAEEFLKYMIILKGLNLSKREEQKLIDGVLDLVNLRENKRQRIGEFSGGMRQRLGIAQSLLNDPKLLLLDEPTAGLDPQERVRLRNVISRAAMSRIVIWSTHIVSDIEYISREILMLQEGKLVEFETPDALISKIEGKVFEICISDDEANKTVIKCPIGNIHCRGHEIIYRVVADENPGGESVRPTLEDVYLYYFSEISEEG